MNLLTYLNSKKQKKKNQINMKTLSNNLKEHNYKKCLKIIRLIYAFHKNSIKKNNKV